MRLILTLMAALMLSATALASPVTQGEFALKSNNIYRGVDITSDNFSAEGRLRLVDRSGEGFYIEGAADTFGSNRLSSMNLRAQARAGVILPVAGVTLDGSVGRVFNPALYVDDYTEARLAAETNYGIFGLVDFYGSANRVITGAERDWYFTGGVLLRDLFIEGLDVRAGTAYYQYAGSDTFSWDRNLFDAEVSFALLGDVSLFAYHSQGALGVNRTPLGNHTMAGVRLSF